MELFPTRDGLVIAMMCGCVAGIIICGCGGSESTRGIDGGQRAVDAHVAADGPVDIYDASLTSDAPSVHIDAMPQLDATLPPDSAAAPDATAAYDAPIPDAPNAPPDASQPDAPTGGSTATVVASLNSDTFVIDSTWGLQIFEAKLLCFGVVEGDHVTFSQPHGACVSNTFTNQRTGNSCDVWCPSGTAETGTIVSVSNFDTYVIQLAGGQKTFEAQVACFANLPGHHVVFTDPTSFCFSNTFINLDANNSCDVYCK